LNIRSQYDIIKVGRLTSFKGSPSMLRLMFILELTCFKLHRKELQNSICLGYKMTLLVKKETSSSEKTKRWWKDEIDYLI